MKFTPVFRVLTPAFRVLVGACVVLAGLLPAQTPLPTVVVGHRLTARWTDRSGPFALRGCAIDPFGQDVFVARHSDVLRVAPDGTATTAFSLPIGGTIGFLARPTSSNDLLVADLTHATLHRLPLLGGAPTSFAIPANAFDVDVAQNGAIVVSANPAWPAPGARTGLWCVGPSTTPREIVALRGASGPLAFDASGNLWYAIQSDLYPTPPGAVQIVRFAAAAVAAALAGGPPLRESDAVVAFAGLDGAYDLAFDDRGRLHWSDPQRGTVSRTLPGATAIDPTPLVPPPTIPGTQSVSALAFVRVGGATFDPFQPEHSTLLAMVATNQTTDSWVVVVRPQRASLTAPASSGPGRIDVDVDGMPPHAAVALWWSPQPLHGDRVVLALDGVPIWCALALAPMPIATLHSADAVGSLRLPLQYPGGLNGALSLQAFGLAPTSPIATSNAAVLQLVP